MLICLTISVMIAIIAYRRNKKFVSKSSPIDREDFRIVIPDRHRFLGHQTSTITMANNWRIAVVVVWK